MKTLILTPLLCQLGAHKLNPEGTPLLPRRVDRNVIQFLTLYWDVLPFMRAADWQKRRVDEILLVDTHAMSSVRGVTKKTRVRVIDHHMGASIRWLALSRRAGGGRRRRFVWSSWANRA
ncbi:MAG: hypothetical protein M5U34_27765 [Chloroflexi bacterium]|nr:hypothetical protein [Chloroflexota bacterium]